MRYVAFVGAVSSASPHVESLIRSDEDWELVFDEPGVIVLVCDEHSGIDRVYALKDRSGVIVGRIFGEPSVHFWGSYVAFADDGSVFRDPSGSQQCFYAELDGFYVFFSRLKDFEKLTGVRGSIDWSYVATRVAYGSIPNQRTGIVGVRQLMPGECFGKAEHNWDLSHLIEREAIFDRDEAGPLLHSTTRACVHAWASCYSHILLLLSGGLDSAIVLSCLRDAPSRPKVTAVNFFSPGADSDERQYARLAAEHAGVELVELPRDPTVRWNKILNLRRAPEPYAAIGALQTHRQIAGLIREGALFSGTGGDLLFYRHWAFLAVADSMRSRRFQELPLLSAAYLDRSSVWKVLGQALYYSRMPYRILPKPTDARGLLGPEAFGIPPPQNPWMESLLSAPRGKQYQAACLLYALCALENPLNLPDLVPEVRPLLSPPLVEVALRIPLSLSIHQGRDRALAREAFSGEIPPAIENRQSKGGLEEYARESLMNNLPFARELLLDGRLVAEGLLDHEKLVQVLSQEPSLIPTRLPEIYDYVNIEAWLYSVS